MAMRRFYTIESMLSGSQYKVTRKFSEFEALHTWLVVKNPSRYLMCTLPLRSSVDDAVHKVCRKAELQDVLQLMC
jgi:hypothetical protein